MGGDDQRKSAISLWVPLSFGTTGLLIGFVAGQSTTPIVGTLLPLLFGIIGGGAGFFAVQRSESSGRVGISLALLTSTCLVGTVEGTRLRLQTPWHCFWSICAEPPPSAAKLNLPPDQIDQEKLLLLLSIKMHLQNGVFEAKDRERVFTIAKDATVADLKKLDQELARITLPQTEVRQAPTESEGRPAEVRETRTKDVRSFSQTGISAARGGFSLPTDYGRSFSMPDKASPSLPRERQPIRLDPIVPSLPGQSGRSSAPSPLPSQNPSPKDAADSGRPQM